MNKKIDYLDNPPIQKTIHLCEFGGYCCDNENTKPYIFAGNKIYLCEKHKPKK